MKAKKYDVILYSSDVLPALGLYTLLERLPIKVKVFRADTLQDLALCCEKYQPKLLICLVHESMMLNGALQCIYSHQQNYPEIRQLIITSRLLPLFRSLKAHLSTINVASFKMPLSELSWVITAELMGLHCKSSAGIAADVMLPDRQLLVLLMLSWGYPAEQIAQRMKINAKTVYAHKLNALARLQVCSKQEIVDLYAVIDELRMIVTMLRFRRKDNAESDTRVKKANPLLFCKQK